MARSLFSGLIFIQLFLTSCHWFSESVTPALNYPALVWKKKIIDSVIIGHPYPIVRFGEHVVFVAQAGEFQQKLVAFNAHDGKRVWEWQDYYNHGTPKGLVFADRVYQYDKYLLFGSGGKHYCIDLISGNTVWRRLVDYSSDGMFNGSEYMYGIWGSTDHPRGFTHNIYVGDIRYPERERLIYSTNPDTALGSPFPYRDRSGNLCVVFVEADKDINRDPDKPYEVRIVNYNIDADSVIYKRVILERSRGLMYMMSTVVGERCYNLAFKSIICTDVKDGRVIWYRDFPGSFLFSRFIVVDGTLYANCEDTYLYAVDAETGALKWRTKSSGSSSELFYMDGVLYYVGGGDGKLHAVDASTGQHIFKINPTEGEPYGYGFAQGRPTGFDGLLFVTSWTHAYCFRVKR